MSGKGRFESLLDTIGGTPLVRLNRLAEGIAAAVYVKAEWFNPGGSVKDRAALVVLPRHSDAPTRSAGDRDVAVLVDGRVAALVDQARLQEA